MESESARASLRCASRTARPRRRRRLLAAAPTEASPATGTGPGRTRRGEDCVRHRKRPHRGADSRLQRPLQQRSRAGGATRAVSGRCWQLAAPVRRTPRPRNACTVPPPQQPAPSPARRQKGAAAQQQPAWRPRAERNQKTLDKKSRRQPDAPPPTPATRRALLLVWRQGA